MYFIIVSVKGIAVLQKNCKRILILPVYLKPEF